MKVYEALSLLREANSLLECDIKIGNKVQLIQLAEALMPTAKLVEAEEDKLIEKHKIKLNEDGTLAKGNKDANVRAFIESQKQLTEEDIEFKPQAYSFNLADIENANSKSVPIVFIQTFMKK